MLIAIGFVLSAVAQAETVANQDDAAAVKAATPAMHAPAMPYNYAYPGPVYNRPYYPHNRQAFNGRNSQRFNGRNDWYGNNRMEHMNRVVSDMISDMFGDGAGDFDFDVNIKFKARGKGKGRGDADAKRYSRFRTEQNYRGRGGAYGRGDARQQTGLGRYNSFTSYPYRYSYPYPAYPSYPAYAPAHRPGSKATSAPVTTYPSYPPLAPANAAEKSR